jgi:hypothetical protein
MQRSLRYSMMILAGETLLLLPFLAAAENVSLTLVKGLTIELPTSAQLRESGKQVNWSKAKSIGDIIGDNPSVQLALGQGVELELGVSENAGYAQKVNNLTPLKWLTFQSEMLQAQIQDVRKKSSQSAAMATGDRLSSGHRVLIARSSWYQGDEFHNVLVVDIFHDTKYVSLLFSWVAPEGSSAENLVDQVAASLHKRR